jgi:hypothetical protein
MQEIKWFIPIYNGINNLLERFVMKELQSLIMIWQCITGGKAVFFTAYTINAGTVLFRGSYNRGICLFVKLIIALMSTKQQKGKEYVGMDTTN